jgi:imidazolonepropionase-like amidohydrolase
MPLLPILLLLLNAPSPAQPSPAPPPAATRITHVRVIDGTGRAPLEDATLVLRDGRIFSITRAAAAPPSLPNEQVIDATGQTVIPGLINAHGHLALVDGARNSPDFYTRDHVLDELRQYERYGVTTMLSLGLNRNLIYPIRAEQQAGTLDGATVFVADHGIGVKDGAPPIPHQPDQLDLPTTPAQARQDVDAAAARHTNFIKIWVDSLYGTKPTMQPDISQAAIDEAHKDHIPIAAHIFYLADAKRLVDGGINVLAHSVRDQPVDQAFLQSTRSRGVFYIPTLTVDESFYTYAAHPAFMDTPFFRNAANPEQYALLTSPAYARKVQSDPLTAQHRKDHAIAAANLKAAYAAGLKVAFGTDSGANPYRIPGFAEHHELALMVEAGLTPMKALTAATATNAQLLGIAAHTGTLVAGHQADLILLRANPLDDIHNTQKIVATWHNGRRIPPPVAPEIAPRGQLRMDLPMVGVKFRLPPAGATRPAQHTSRSDGPPAQGAHPAGL